MKMKMPKYTQAFIDRHGIARFYFRKAGSKQMPLPGPPWSPQFMAAYAAALEHRGPRIDIGKGVSGTEPLERRLSCAALEAEIEELYEVHSRCVPKRR